MSHDGGSCLSEPLEFDRFEVVAARDITRDQLRCALDQLGEPTADLGHVFVDPTWVRSQGGDVARTSHWQEQWGAMVEFASDRGWVDGEGRVRAHVVVGDAP